jgi:anti-sigma regulatory factor (Ser/Thr protein kinase)
MCRKAETSVACEPAAVGWARRWTLGELTSIYAGLGETSLDIQTVVSELVTNALQAECRRLTLSLDAHHTFVRIATTDDAAGDPVKLSPSPDMAHGRGLLIVDAFSKRWGVEREALGKTVWAEVALSRNPLPNFDCHS